MGDGFASGARMRGGDDDHLRRQAGRLGCFRGAEEIEQQKRNGEWDRLTYEDPSYRVLEIYGKLAVEIEHRNAKGDTVPFRIYMTPGDINRLYQRACNEGFYRGDTGGVLSPSAQKSELPA